MKTLVELRKLELNDLKLELNDATIESFKVKLPVKNAESKNSHLVKNYRRYIAKIKTLIKEKGSN